MLSLIAKLGLTKLAPTERQQLACELASEAILGPALVDPERIAGWADRAADAHAPLPWAAVTAGVRDVLEEHRG